MEWHPTTVDAVKKIIEGDLKECDDEQVSAFKKYAVEPYAAPILRYDEMGNAVVVARRGDEVIYWEDVEEGFNLSNGQTIRTIAREADSAPRSRSPREWNAATKG
jgi:hypothetical protein